MKKYQAIEPSSINGRIEEVLFNAAFELTAVRHHEEFIGCLKKSSVVENVTDPIEKILYEKCTPEYIKLLKSKAGNLNMCSHFFTYGETIYSCIECANDPTCVMCEECFFNSNHVSHRYNSMESGAEGGCCDCGDEEAWKSSNTCSIHQSDGLQTILTPEFRDHAKTVLTCLLNYLIKVGTSPYVFPDSPFLNTTFDPEYAANQVNYCVLLLNDESHNYVEVVTNFETTLEISNDHALSYAKFIDKHGIGSVFFSYDESECQQVKERIDNFRCEASSEVPLKSLVITHEHFMHMCICEPLMVWIHDYVSKKAELCDLLSHLIFSDTRLIPYYAHQETHLWKAYRHKLIYSLLSCALYSEFGRNEMTKNYLKYLETWYGNFMSDDHHKPYFFVNLTVQFITSPSLATYLIENNFLYRIIDLFAVELHRIGITHRCSISNLSKHDPKLIKQLNRAYYACGTISECLYNPFDPTNWSKEFKAGVLSGALRLVKFLQEFNEPEPIQKTLLGKDNEASYEELTAFVMYIHGLMMNIAKWIVFDTQIANTVIEELWSIFESEFAKNVDFQDKCHSEILERLITFLDINKDTFSLFNLPVRFFTDILMDLIITNRLDNRLRDKIFSSEFIMLWLAQPVISSLSFHFNYTLNEWRRNPDSMNAISFIYKSHPYCYYLFLQDFNFLQILIATVNPDTFIRLMLLNFYTEQRTGMDMLCSLGTLTQSCDRLKADLYEQVVRLILAAITERHFIGIYSNPQYEFLKRQVISILCMGKFTRRLISHHLTRYREVDIIHDNLLTDILNDVSTSATDYYQFEKRYELKKQYFRQINRFFYLFDNNQVSIVYVAMPNIIKNSVKFQPPPLAELRSEFHGMIDFIISDAFISFLLSIVQNSCSSPNSAYNQTSIFEMVFMCLGVVASTLISLNSSGGYSHKCEAFFGPQPALEDKTLSQFLIDFKPHTKEQTLIMIIDYLLEVIGSNCDNASSKIFLHGDENKRKAKEMKEQILKQFEETSKRFYEVNPDYRLYENMEKEAPHSEQKSLETLQTEERIYCFLCKDISRININHDINITTFPQEFIICARLKLTRRISDHHLDSSYIFGVDETPITKRLQISMEEVRSSDINLPKLMVSGCCHVVHISCARQSSAFGNAIQVSDDLPTSYSCQLCSVDDNLILPYMTPVKYNSSCEIGLKDFAMWIMARVNHIFLMTTDGNGVSLLRKNEKLTSKVETVNEELSSVDQFISTKDLFGCFFKNFIDSEGQSETHHSCTVIAATHNCLINTIKSFEIINREKHKGYPLFHHSFTDSTNFRVATHLARFCYHCSGQVLFLNPDYQYSNILLSLIKFGLALPCEPFRQLLEHIFLYPSSNPNQKYRLRDTDYFSSFVSTFISLSCINHIHGLLKQETSPFSIEILCVRLFYSLLTISVFIFFSPNDSHFDSDIYVPENDVEQLADLFNIYCGQVSRFPSNWKMLLYQEWLFTVLPFCRQAAMLYYQIFNLRPSTALTQSVYLPPAKEVRELLTYLHIPFDFSQLIARDDLICLNYYYSTIKSDNVVRTHLIAPPEKYYKTYSLIHLPVSYLELIKDMRGRLCNTCESPANQAFKCLICGEIIVESYICQCNTQNSKEKLIENLKRHVRTCDCFDGIFFCLKPPYLCYLTDGRISKLVYSIYENDYGESMLRSRSVLHLSEKDYRRLNYLYQRDLISSLPSTIFK